MEAYECRQKDSVGSSRIRGTWLTKYWPEAEIFQIGKKYDAVIFQKAYFERYMKEYDGIKILDICDPDWLDGRPIKACVELCDAVTCSSVALKEFLESITDKPVHYIPDRMDLDYYPKQKIHKGRARSVVWFGYSNNHKLIDSCLFTLARLGLSLTVISDHPYMPPANVQGIDNDWINENLTNIKYDQDTVNHEILESGDIVINPKIEDGRFKYKSDNKTYTAWALGIPVATNSDELEALVEEEARIKEADKRLAEIKKFYHTQLSVDQYKEIIDKIFKEKT